jgi:hypothetical protein
MHGAGTGVSANIVMKQDYVGVAGIQLAVPATALGAAVAGTAVRASRSGCLSSAHVACPAASVLFHCHNTDHKCGL